MAEIHRPPWSAARHCNPAIPLLLSSLLISIGSTAYGHADPTLEVRFSDGPATAAANVIALHRAQDAPPVTAAIRLTNAASVAIKVSLDEGIPWLVIEPRTLALGPGRSAIARISATAAGLSPGEYTGTININTTDPARRSSPLDALLTVSEPLPDVVTDRAAVTEISTACSNGNVFVQFIELAAPPGEGFPADLRLIVEDRSGFAVFDGNPIGDEIAGHAATRWLLGTPEFKELTGATPDRFMTAFLDGAGGTITLRDGDKVLQRFSYGSTGGVNAPRPGSSLARSAAGSMVELPPTPETSHGVRPARLSCVCPLTSLIMKGIRQNSDLSEWEVVEYVPGVFSGRTGYSTRKGSLYAEVGSLSAGVETVDRYRVTGLQAGTLLNVTAVLRFGGRIGGSGSIVGEISGDGFPAVRDVRRYSADNRDVTSEVRLPLQLTALRSYELKTVLGVQTSAVAQARLVFEGLPPGARVESCRGYVFEEPPLDLSVQARVSRGIARIVWKAPGIQPLANIERRRGSEPWKPVAAGEPDAFGTIIHEDPSVEPGVPYAYRLNLWSGPAGETSLDWSVPPFRIAGVFPNPTRGPIHLALDVPDDAPVRIAVYDVAGRRIGEKQFDYPEAGRYEVVLSDISPATAGIYFVAVARGGQRELAKVLVRH